VVTPNIIDRIVWSDYVYDNFKIFISLPEKYDNQRLEKYPVVYFLDGGSSTFHEITADYMAKKYIPEVITIGIGYPGASQRNRDYTFGFSNFYQFLKEELIPLIDTEYNTDPFNRTLFGHSYGGICALFTMFQYFDYDDILFNNIIAASPSIWWPDGKQAFSMEASLYFNTIILPVNLYMTVGSLEGTMVDAFNKMQEVLDGRNYRYFNSSYHINQNKDHSTNKELSFREGIKWVLNQEIIIPSQTNSNVLNHGQIAAITYPNPVKDVLKIKLDNWISGSCMIEFINCAGRTLYQGTMNDPDLKLDVSGFPKGFYILKIKGNEFQSSSKIVVN